MPRNRAIKTLSIDTIDAAYKSMRKCFFKFYKIWKFQTLDVKMADFLMEFLKFFGNLSVSDDLEEKCFSPYICHSVSKRHGGPLSFADTSGIWELNSIAAAFAVMCII
jgi:hypothetical protein